MSDKHQNTLLEKEFELERLILFSDAVFAIAITLLVIDIKWPDIPENFVPRDLLTLFKPTIFQFVAFAISFFFIGNAWSRHLAIFRQIRRYDRGLIKRNLFFLFFIVIFPFTASGVAGHLSPTFIWPIFFYTFNVLAVFFFHFILCRYIFIQKPSLSTEEHYAEKKYIYLHSKYSAITLLIMVSLSFALFLLFPEKPIYCLYSFYISPILVIYSKRTLKKYKPRHVEEP